MLVHDFLKHGVYKLLWCHLPMQVPFGIFPAASNHDRVCIYAIHKPAQHGSSDAGYIHFLVSQTTVLSVHFGFQS